MSKLICRVAAVATAALTAVVSGPTGSAGAIGRQGNTAPSGVPGHWSLAWSDEFNSNRLGPEWTNGWEPDGSGISMNVNDAEQDCFADKNVRVHANNLELWVTHEANTCRGITQPYTGALVSTKHVEQAAFRPGDVIEAKMLVESPDGEHGANWPAFWTDGYDWPEEGEIDIMEGQSKGRACYNIHNVQKPGGTQSCVDAHAGRWHTYGAHRRTDGYVDFYYDGTLLGTKWLGVDTPHYIILNHSVHKRDTAYIKAPAVVKVDYVRVYR